MVFPKMKKMQLLGRYVLQIFYLFQYAFPHEVAKDIQFFFSCIRGIFLDTLPFIGGDGLGGQKIDEFLVQFFKLFFGES
jgi:hypothetical protein